VTGLKWYRRVQRDVTALHDPASLFDASLGRGQRRAIDLDLGAAVTPASGRRSFAPRSSSTPLEPHRGPSARASGLGHTCRQPGGGSRRELPILARVPFAVAASGCVRGQRLTAQHTELGGTGGPQVMNGQVRSGARIAVSSHVIDPSRPQSARKEFPGSMTQRSLPSGSASTT
jgi:hypothetical protein